MDCGLGEPAANGAAQPLQQNHGSSYKLLPPRESTRESTMLFTRESTATREGTAVTSMSLGEQVPLYRRRARYNPPEMLEPGFQRRLGSTPLDALVVIPDETQWLNAWDVFIVLVLFVTAYYEPYAVAILPHDPAWALMLNHLLDGIFTVDMLLQFFIAYSEPLESAAPRELWVKEIHLIAKRYCCSIPLSENGKAGWFWIDLVTVLPGWLEAVVPRGAVENSKALVLLRLLRLVRLTRLVRLHHLVAKYHQKYGFPFYVVELCKFAFITTLTVHFLACVWIISEGRVTNGKLSYRTDKESWLSALIAAKGDSCSPDAAHDHTCVYFIAVYWATMTLTTVGYGDITAQNPVEYVVCTLCMLFVAYVWAYIVGKIVTILEALDPHEKNFRQQTDDLQDLMSNRRLPKELQARLRRYMHEAKVSSLQRLQHDQLQQSTSESLQREVAGCSGVFEDFRRGVFWAADLEQSAVLDLVRALQPSCWGPNEVMIVPQALLVMRRGIAAVRGRILNRGDTWGSCDILLVTRTLIERSFPRTLSYVDNLALHRSSLLEVCNNFPHADRRVRRAQIRTAVFRAFIMTARARSPRRSTMTICSKITSFVNPGQYRLNMGIIPSSSTKDEVKLADVKFVLDRLTEQHEVIEERMNIILRHIGRHSNASA